MRREMKKPYDGMDLSRIEVSLPKVSVNLSDLAYMTNLSKSVDHNPTSVRTIDKLIFLGLIEYSTVPTKEKDMEDFFMESDRLKSCIREAVKHDRWEEVWDCARDLSHLEKPEPRKGYTLTATGVELLSSGQTVSEVAATRSRKRLR